MRVAVIETYKSGKGWSVEREVKEESRLEHVVGMVIGEEDEREGWKEEVVAEEKWVVWSCEDGTAEFVVVEM